MQTITTTPAIIVKDNLKFKASDKTEARIGPRIDPRPKNPVFMAEQ